MAHFKGDELMFKDIDLQKALPKKEAAKIMEGLVLKLMAMQRTAKELKIPVMLVFEGWEAAGKGTLINEFIHPLDPRGFKVHGWTEPNKDELLRPYLWRFWSKTPEAGRITVLDKSWYERLFNGRAHKKLKGQDWERQINETNSFERQLTDGGTLLIKFFLHISKSEQKKRFKELESSKATKWRVNKEDWAQQDEYDAYLDAFQESIENTDTEWSPWTIIESTDRHYATIKMFDHIISQLDEAIQKKTAQHQLKLNSAHKASKAPAKTKQDLEDAVAIAELDSKLKSSILDQSDLSLSLDKKTYSTKLKKLQKRLRELEHEIYIRRIPVIVLYEGWDAAGKGGNIKRLTENLDPRGYEVIPVAAPTDIERLHHYLWRFWINMPKAGHISIFDRSWYGRVLVERVEGFCSTEDWKRSYREINEMEACFTDYDAVVLKFWLNIDKDEQLKRFNDRKENPYKTWKLTEEDWRNRDKWELYKEAVDEMLVRTGTLYAPWIVVESNDKYHARIKVLECLVAAIEAKL